MRRLRLQDLAYRRCKTMADDSAADDKAQIINLLGSGTIASYYASRQRKSPGRSQGFQVSSFERDQYLETVGLLNW